MTNQTKSSLGGMIGGAASAAMGNPLGLLAVGGGLAGLLAGIHGPGTPDYASEVEGRYATAGRQLARSQDRARQAGADDAAARGLTGSGGAVGRNDLVQRALDARAMLEGERADALARARNRQAAEGYAAAVQRRQNVAQGAGGMLQNLAFMAAMKEADGGAPGDKGGKGGDGSGGGGQGGRTTGGWSSIMGVPDSGQGALSGTPTGPQAAFSDPVGASTPPATGGLDLQGLAVIASLLGQNRL